MWIEASRMISIKSENCPDSKTANQKIQSHKIFWVIPQLFLWFSKLFEIKYWISSFFFGFSKLLKSHNEASAFSLVFRWFLIFYSKLVILYVIRIRIARQVQWDYSRPFWRKKVIPQLFLWFSKLFEITYWISSFFFGFSKLLKSHIEASAFSLVFLWFWIFYSK
jgi:hypothetical protein